MKDTDLQKLTLKELHALSQRIGVLIDKKAPEERLELKNKFRQMAAEAGFELDEVIEATKSGKGKRKVSSKGTFKNPENPDQTWSGRGRMPNWLVAKVRSGAQLDDFRTRAH